MQLNGDNKESGIIHEGVATRGNRRLMDGRAVSVTASLLVRKTGVPLLTTLDKVKGAGTFVERRTVFSAIQS